MRRTLTVVSGRNVTRLMKRCVFSEDSLKTFRSVGFDDHVKIFFPAAGSATGIARDFTPRRIDSAAGLLTIDIALHDTGPATTWARQAKPGDLLTIGGPRGSLVIADDFDWYLMIGDATALPAIGRRLEELRAGAPVTTIVLIADEQEQQSLQTAAAWQPVWLNQSDTIDADEQSIRRVLNDTTFPPGDGHIWLAGESGMVRCLRAYLVEDRMHLPEWIRAAGYWKRGAPGAHERL